MARAESNLPDRRQSAWRSPFVRAWVGLVVVMLLANIAMIVTSSVTFSGLVVDDYYERGKQYGNTLRAKALSVDLGWRINLDGRVTPTGRLTTFHAVGTDREGRPLRVDHVELFAYRPSDADRDFSVIFDKVGAGRYSGELSFPLKGVWDLLLVVRKDQDEYTVARRVQVPAG